jgi:hypothetical protein
MLFLICNVGWAFIFRHNFCNNVDYIDYRAMFTSGLNETMQDRIVMHEMEFTALRDIIYFFYTGEIKVRYH